MTTDVSFDYEARLAVMPHAPGCYLMKDRSGTIIYIGKAKDLKNRVRNYFQASGDPRPFVKRLPGLLSEIETIITPTEKDALILESTLIKLHLPRYNVRLKDDKAYMSLRVDTTHRWPRVEVVRKRDPQDGARYFGPYESSGDIRRALHVLNRHFQLRTCTDAVLERRTRPCLQYQIKRCPGPCVFPIPQEVYGRHVEQAMMFLSGRADELLEELLERMMEASEAMAFEQAAHYRDQISSIRQALERQQVVSEDHTDRDAIGLYREGDRALVQLLTVRRGRLEGARAFSFTDQEFPDEELLSSFVNLYYQGEMVVPDEVLLPLELGEAERGALSELLSERRGKKVAVLAPQRGAKRAIVDTAMTNAQHTFEDRHRKQERAHDLLEKLQSSLKLRNFPAHIECYDISNFQGDPIVGSQVVFIDGEPANKLYRHYRMKTVTTQDDFASMHELLTRRLTRVIERGEDAPDLLVIDGGKGQLGQAMKVLEELGLDAQIDVIGLAKSRVDKVGFQDEDVTRSPERVFVPGRKNPIVLRQNSAELFLLERLRDEAHRTAIGFHKQVRRKQSMRSSLDEVPGIGPVTRRALLKHFGSLKAIQAASEEALRAAPGVNARVARELRAFFHDDEETPEGEAMLLAPEQEAPDGEASDGAAPDA